ncbi:hypothetical protein DJ010_18490 [Nocardioides silvaticus]|uniref:Zinc-finger domain-containing protein n=1 Tax=Nocardioides silvaticus TaxID=2201891 RepID=A0A316TDH5_9ACTN|nr:hypothetical protein [Nocardioides silvaticus]PWN01531.1 hypothetical protein DJ010_18490 [Nocardioides silvaticus]
MIGHLGARASALLDGQLSQAEAEEAWAHVYECHACRDLVEREGWVKTRLAGLSGGVGSASPDLKGSLLNLTPGEQFLVDAGGRGSVRRGIGVAVLGGGALGAAMVGVLALGFAPGSPSSDRRPPARIETPVASDDGATGTPAERAFPVHVNTPVGTAVTLADPGGLPAAAVVPAWVQQLLPQ